MKKVIITMFIAFCAVASFAQGRFSVGAEVALPMGDFGDVVGPGFGGSVRYESPINTNLSWMATAGFNAFGEKDDSGVTVTSIPVLGGLKYYFTESFTGFYAGAEIGVAFNAFKVDALDIDESSTDFAFGPQLGYHLGSIDISARYFIMSADGEEANSLGLRLAYVFGGGK
jgi:hypothetical protein